MASVAEGRANIIAWSNSQAMLRDHIQNGVARGLYPQRTADLAFRYLEGVLEIETDNLIDLLKEES